ELFDELDHFRQRQAGEVQRLRIEGGLRFARRTDHRTHCCFMINKSTVPDSNQRRGSTNRRGMPKLLLAAAGTIAMLAAACAHERPPRRIVDSQEVPLPACPTPVPTLPEQAARDGVSGVVLVGYSIDPTGRVGNHELEDTPASPILFDAVRRWLQQCRAQEPSASRRIVELFSFPPPKATSARDESPLPLEDLNARATRPVRSNKCSPDRP